MLYLVRFYNLQPRFRRIFASVLATLCLAPIAHPGVSFGSPHQTFATFPRRRPRTRNGAIFYYVCWKVRCSCPFVGGHKRLLLQPNGQFTRRRNPFLFRLTVFSVPPAEVADVHVARPLRWTRFRALHQQRAPRMFPTPTPSSIRPCRHSCPIGLLAPPSPLIPPLSSSIVSAGACHRKKASTHAAQAALDRAQEMPRNTGLNSHEQSSGLLRIFARVDTPLRTFLCQNNLLFV